MVARLSSLALASLTVVSAADSIKRTPLRQVAGQSGTLFHKLSSEQSGVSHVNRLDENHPLARLYYSGFGCGSVVMSDLNGDGRNDLFFTGGSGKNGLYLQQEKRLSFKDVTAQSGLEAGRWNSGAAAADLDQDGDQDLIVCSYDQPLQLFLNDGEGQFTEIGKQAGFTVGDAFMMPTFRDYDQDGDLDLFVVTNQLYRKGGRPKAPPVENGPDGKLRVKKEFERYYGIKIDANGELRLDDIGRPDYLYRNDSKDGVLKFTDVSKEAGIDKIGFGLSATWFDFNKDGWPDLHVGNDFSEPDRLYVNQQDGTFKDVARIAFPTCAWFSMGADAADIDGDGLEDLFCADMAFTTHYKQKVGMGQMGAKQALLESIQPLQVMRNHLFLNSGMGRFREAAQLAGLGKSDWTWAVKFTDLDLDGRLDLFVTNGAIRSFNHADYDAENVPGMTNWDRWKGTPPRPEANLAFRNTKSYYFEKTSKNWGLDEVNVSHGLACGDLDGDGDPDLVITNLGETVSIFENTSTAPRIAITLDHPVSEGAVLALGGQRKTVRTANGYYTSSSPTQSFSSAQNAELKITWPDGTEQAVPNLIPGNHYQIAKKSAVVSAPPRSKTYFSAPQIFKEIAHREEIFDDFALQALLPHKLSQLGPGTASGDIDGDGDLDFFLGGATGKSGQIFQNTGKGLSPIRCDDLSADALKEDLCALFFDADDDGDLDLYVGSGSYEVASVGEAISGDRLYKNDGSGKFTRAQNIPKHDDVRSCVRACDYDQDGDLDLFLGSRVKPGEYPLSTP
ncbi:MAG: FG-GAP repeat domain-containing protein, partial [Akkermansiaceae bacterium]